MGTTLALAAGVSAGVQALGIVAVAAIRRTNNIYSTVVLVSLLTAPGVAFGVRSWIDPAFTLDGVVYLAVIHLALGGLFFHFMTLPDRSVTLRVLVELLLAPDESLSIGALTDRYGIRVMIESRIYQLQDGGFLRIGQDGAITLLPRGLFFGRFVTAGRALFGIESAN